MPRLTSEQRLHAIGMLESGDTQRVVAQRLGCSQVTICNLATRYRDTNAAADRQRSGRPRVTTRAEDRYILLTHLRDRFRPATRTAAETPRPSKPLESVHLQSEDGCIPLIFRREDHIEARSCNRFTVATG